MTDSPEHPPRRRRRWRRSIAALMLLIGALAPPMLVLKRWLDLPPCASVAGGPSLWSTPDCRSCHAAASPTRLAALAPIDPPEWPMAGHDRLMDPARCIDCHAP